VTARLAAIAAFVPQSARVADIGSGHGQLPLELLGSGRASWCVATDTDAASLDALARAAARFPLRLEVRTGDGLEALEPSDRIEVAVIAGMGARRICRILTSSRRPALGIRRFVLAPQAEPALLRGWLLDRGLRIVEEELVEEGGRFYPVIAAEPGEPGDLLAHPRLAPEELLEAGPCLVRSPNPTLLRYWQGQQERLEGILRSLPPGGRAARAASALARARRIVGELAGTGSSRRPVRSSLGYRSRPDGPEGSAGGRLEHHRASSSTVLGRSS
jgi:tRNA (adenine22-N1)-methyltransferase